MEFSLRLLEIALRNQERDCEMWKENIELYDGDSEHELLVRMAKGNLPSNEVRVQDLKDAISLIREKAMELKAARYATQGKTKKDGKKVKTGNSDPKGSEDAKG